MTITGHGGFLDLGWFEPRGGLGLVFIVCLYVWGKKIFLETWRLGGNVLLAGATRVSGSQSEIEKDLFVSSGGNSFMVCFLD